MNIVKLGLTAAALAGGLVLAIPESQAMPVAPVAAAASADAGIQEARLVCGPYRCFRRFGYYPRPLFRRYYGWRRPVYRRPFVRRFYY